MAAEFAPLPRASSSTPAAGSSSALAVAALTKQQLRRLHGMALSPVPVVGTSRSTAARPPLQFWEGQIHTMAIPSLMPEHCSSGHPELFPILPLLLLVLLERNLIWTDSMKPSSPSLAPLAQSPSARKLSPSTIPTARLTLHPSLEPAAARCKKRFRQTGFESQQRHLRWRRHGQCGNSGYWRECGLWQRPAHNQQQRYRFGFVN